MPSLLPVLFLIFLLVPAPPLAAEQGKKEKGAAKRQEPSICDCS